MPRASEEVLQQIRVVLAKAMEKGVDPAEALDRAALIHTMDRSLQTRRTTLATVADTLDEIGCKQLAETLGERLATTPLDMKRQIVAWLRETAAQK